MDDILSYIQVQQPKIIDLIRRFVECESPSDAPEAVNRFGELVADTVAPFAKVKAVGGGKSGRHVVCEMNLPGRREHGQVLALGHSDTVWPLGTLRTMPFREEDGRLWGPGVLDMKSGIAFLIFAVRAMREMELPAPSKVVLQLNADEEVGSVDSRALTEKNAARSHTVLVLEPGTGLEGNSKPRAREWADIRWRCGGGRRTRAWISGRARAPSWNWRGRLSESRASRGWSAG